MSWAHVDIFIFLPPHLPTYPPTHLPTYPPSHLPTYPPTHLLTARPTHLPTYPPIYLSIYLSIRFDWDVQIWSVKLNVFGQQKIQICYI